MATLTDSRPDHIEPIDQNAEPEFQELRFSVPGTTDIDWHSVRLTYDRLSDTLLVFAADRSQPAVVYGDDNVWSYLVNPDTTQFVGWQVESVLARAVREDPRLFDLLDHAQLMGLTPYQLREMRRRALGVRGRLETWLNQAFARLRRRRVPGRDAVLRSLLATAPSPTTTAPSFRG